MRTLSSALLTELGLTVTRPGYLAEIAFPTPMRLSSLGTLTWNSLQWIGRDLEVRFGPIVGRAGQTVSVSIDNDAQSMSAEILANGVTGRSLKIWVAYAGALASADPYLAFNGNCDGAEITPDKVTISGALISPAALYCPRKRINQSTGFSALLPAGARVRIGNHIYHNLRRI
jgi:hypothetical protein